MKTDNKYTQMQQEQYDREASHWSITNIDPVVGGFDAHNSWTDYDEFLFKNIDTNGKIALDFGTGPGRNIAKFADKFERIDGTDISQINLNNAKLWSKHKNIKFSPNLYKTNGTDLSEIKSNTYDIVFSTICLQHICVHEIRYNLFAEFLRVLKVGGSICIQMGFGPSPNKSGVGYYENNYDAAATNGHNDAKITDVIFLKNDIEKIGFTNFDYDLRPTGPGDGHSQWIFFRATK